VNHRPDISNRPTAHERRSVAAARANLDVVVAIVAAWLSTLVARVLPALTAHAAAAGRSLPRAASRDRGAVSIEQVLWYAAAAISVAVVAAIIWSQIRSTASTPVNQPSAP
jgi:hypothetical protein